MKKLVAALSLVALSAGAVTGGFDVVAPPEDGLAIVYSADPNSLETFDRYSTLEVAVVVEVAKSNQPIQHKRLRVSGCNSQEGKIALASMDYVIGESPVEDWDLKSTEVHDLLAVTACSIWRNAGHSQQASYVKRGS
jgi:hypothetical protein